MFIKVSKMLLSVATISILFSATPAHAIWPFTKKVTVNVSSEMRGKSFPPCTADMIGEVCQSSSGLIQLQEVQTDAACRERRMVGQCDKYLGPKAKVKYVEVYTAKEGGGNRRGSGNGNGDGHGGCVKTIVVNGKTYVVCGEADVVDDGEDGSDVAVDAKDGDGGILVFRKGPSANSTRARVRYRDPRAAAQAEYDELYAFCNGWVEDAIASCGDTLEAKRRARDDKAAALEDLRKKADDAYNAALSGCRADCISIAINPAESGLTADCGLDRKTLANSLDKNDVTIKPTDDLREQERKRALREFLDKGQSAETEALLKWVMSDSNDQSKKLGDVCSQLVNSKKNPKCATQFEGTKPKNVGKCELWGIYVDAKVAYDTAVRDQKKLIADVEKLEKVPGSCTLSGISDIVAVKATGGCDCLQKASDSCPGALAAASAQLQQILSQPIARNAYCATCGYGGSGADGGGGCAYGYGCGVSKTAQMISAIGGVAVPLGLGIMNLAMWNKGVNACTSMYGQSLDVSRTVGLPPPAPSCGGMGGFGGGFMGGMGGMGMMPGMMGMGGMGMMGMGMPGMYNPMMGLNGGISAGINLGFGNGMYNPYMMGGQMGMGMQGMYNPMMMGQMGGMYNPMMGMQNNGYGVQQQMMDAQMRMQQMSAQNMVLQQSAMMGGMYGQMGGMMGMGMSPYYNMGYAGGVNPMMNMGAMGNFTMNPWAYAGAGGYNPMMYGGTGISGGISGGINLGFNTGFAGGAGGGYNYGYPSMATPPYAGYNNYGYNAGGYGPYGNTGYYPSYAGGGSCGWQVGIPCI